MIMPAVGKKNTTETMTDGKKQTAVNWLVSQLNKPGFAEVITEEEIQQAKDMEKEVAQQYAEFAIECDRKELPVLEFDGWINL